jgi:hypothetical protein
MTSAPKETFTDADLENLVVLSSLKHREKQVNDKDLTVYENIAERT